MERVFEALGFEGASQGEHTPCVCAWPVVKNRHPNICVPTMLDHTLKNARQPYTMKDVVLVFVLMEPSPHRFN